MDLSRDEIEQISYFPDFNAVGISSTYIAQFHAYVLENLFDEEPTNGAVVATREARRLWLAKIDVSCGHYTSLSTNINDSPQVMNYLSSVNSAIINKMFAWPGEDQSVSKHILPTYFRSASTIMTFLDWTFETIHTKWPRTYGDVTPLSVARSILEQYILFLVIIYCISTCRLVPDQSVAIELFERLVKDQKYEILKRESILSSFLFIFVHERIKDLAGKMSIQMIAAILGTSSYSKPTDQTMIHLLQSLGDAQQNITVCPSFQWFRNAVFQPKLKQLLVENEVWSWIFQAMSYQQKKQIGSEYDSLSQLRNVMIRYPVEYRPDWILSNMLQPHFQSQCKG